MCALYSAMLCITTRRNSTFTFAHTAHHFSRWIASWCLLSSSFRRTVWRSGGSSWKVQIRSTFKFSRAVHLLLRDYRNECEPVPLHLTEYKIPNVPTKMRISHNKIRNIEKSRINDKFLSFKKGRKRRNSSKFQNFFFNFEIGHK